MDDRPRVLVVEDEGIVAQCLVDVLEELGYAVAAVAATGEAAVERAAAVRLDVVLMDIVLRGARDGATAARQIQAGQDVPVVYLTALADDDTAQRTGVSDTFGIVRKPFDERDLVTSIEVTRYRHAQAGNATGLADHFAETLGRLPDAAIVVDDQERVAALNAAAETLTGWAEREACGQLRSEVLQLEGGDVEASRRRVVVKCRDGTGRQPAELLRAEVRDRARRTRGVVLVLRR